MDDDPIIGAPNEETSLWHRFRWWFLVRALKRCCGCGAKVVAGADYDDPGIEPGVVEPLGFTYNTGENVCQSCEEYPDG